MGASKPASAAHSEQDPLSEALDVDPDEYEWVREQLETAGIQLQSARLEDADGGDDDDGQEGEGDDDDDDGAGRGGEGGGWTDPSPGGALGELLALLEDGDDQGGDGEQAETEQVLATVDALLARLAPPLPSPPPASEQQQPQEQQQGQQQRPPPRAPLVSLPGPDHDTPLHLAALYGRVGCARRLVAAGADPGAVNAEDGTLPLHDAAAGGYDAIVDLLLEKGAEAGAVARWLATGDEDGDTPLHCAARGNHLSTVLRLLRAGADPCRQNGRGVTPRDESDDDKVRALLERVEEKGGGAGGEARGAAPVVGG